MADAQIDGSLSQMYKPPFKKCAYGEWSLDADIDEYNQNIELTDSNNLIRGDEILIRNDDTGDEELHIVDQIIDQNTVTTVTPILLNFSGDQVRVIRIDHPQPIPQISARIAAANIYDKYFAAQSNPNISDFGKEQRSIATGQLNDILSGRIQLDCQERIGDRFGNPWIDSRYALRELPQQFAAGERDISRPK